MPLARSKPPLMRRQTPTLDKVYRIISLPFLATLVILVIIRDEIKKNDRNILFNINIGEIYSGRKKKINKRIELGSVESAEADENIN